jgi:curved DNA-binding protein CbpA
VKPGVSDEELRAAYRRLVQLHHPDHNNGSPESARRFEEVQDAYAQIQGLRRRTPPPRTTAEPPPTSSDVEARLAEIERELREKARVARERAQQAARQAAAATSKVKRPSDEELGYIKTDDTLGKILADARKEFVERLDDARDEPPSRRRQAPANPITHRVADLLDEFGAKLKGTGDGDSDPAGDTEKKARKRP